MVLCDPRTTAVLAVIELDDRSHDRPERRRRDEFLNAAFAAAKVSLLRFNAAARYQPLVIRERVLQAISAARANGSSANDFDSGKLQNTAADEAPRNRTNKGRWGRRNSGARRKPFPDRLRRPIIVGAKGLPASRGERRRSRQSAIRLRRTSRWIGCTRLAESRSMALADSSNTFLISDLSTPFDCRIPELPIAQSGHSLRDLRVLEGSAAQSSGVVCRVFLMSVGLIRAVFLSSLVRPGRMPQCLIKYRRVARPNSVIGRTLFRPSTHRSFCL